VEGPPHQVNQKARPNLKKKKPTVNPRNFHFIHNSTESGHMKDLQVTDKNRNSQKNTLNI